MKRTTKQSLIIAVIIHVLLVFMGFMLGWVSDWQQEPEPVVFELVPEFAQPAPPTNTPVQEEPIPSLNVPKPDPLEKIPEIPEDEPEPAQKISFDDWAKNRELPERVQRVERKRPTVQNVPQIDSNLRERLDERLSNISVQGLSTQQLNDQSELQRYLGGLRSSIQNLFEATDRELTAGLRFRVRANGTIDQVQVIRSSGDNRFDAAAIRAVRAVRSSGPPPGNRDLTVELTFRGM